MRGIPVKWALGLAAIGLAACGGGDGGELRVMTFNVMCSACGGGAYAPWEDRLLYFSELFTRHDPDLAGIQEIAFASEVEEVRRHTRELTPIFFQPTEGESYADAAIFYRTSRFDAQGSGFYWLSPTPDDPYSLGFAGEQQLPRLVAWAKLRDRATGQVLFFATTHFDNNRPAQERSAPLVLERTAPSAEELPVIFTGDFNSQPSDAAYHTLTSGEGFHFEDSYDLAATHRLEANRDPAPDWDEAGRIDHIFLAGSAARWSVPEWTVDLHLYGAERRFPSDHRAISAVLRAGD